MKIFTKLLLTLLAVFGFVVLAKPTFADTFDMWKGEFVRGNGTIYADAGGEVKLNYVKGQKTFMANVEVYGLLPDTTYMAYMLTGGGWPADNYLVGEFETDEYGYGHLHVNGIEPEDLNLDGKNRRFVIYHTWASSGWALSTSMTVADGDLQPIGSNRGE